MATHSSVLAWRIPGMGEPGGLPSMGSYRVGHDWSDLALALVIHSKIINFRVIASTEQKSTGKHTLLHFLDLCVFSYSVVSDSVMPWIVVRKSPLSMEFSRQEHWSGGPFPSLGDLPNPGIERKSLAFLHWQADSFPLASPGKTLNGKIKHRYILCYNNPPTVFLKVFQYDMKRPCHLSPPDLFFSRLTIYSRSALTQFFKVKQREWEGNGTPLQYFCLESPMDEGAY